MCLPFTECIIILVSRIKTETGTSIIIPPDTERSNCIRIEGDPVGVKAAKNMLLELASKMVGYQRRVGIIHIHSPYKVILTYGLPESS